MTREPEWDDLQRTRMLALAEYEAGIHDGCGIHRSIADTDPEAILEDHICPVCADRERLLRQRHAEEHEREKDYAPERRRRGDGRSTSIRLLGPGAPAKKADGERNERADEREH